MITPIRSVSRLFLFVCIFFCGLVNDSRAQQFSYTSSSSTATYQELTGQTLLNAINAQWNSSYRIPIGFSYNFLGRSFDSLTIETNGYLVFDRDRNYAFTAFNGFADHVDSAGAHAVLSYSLSGSTGSRILKIQFKKIAESPSSSQTISYQVWIRESNTIELITGPNDFQSDPNDSLFTVDTTKYIRIGLLNMNMDTNPRGYFIGGDRHQPQGSPLDDNHPDVVYLHGIPAPGTRFVFTPANQ